MGSKCPEFFTKMIFLISKLQHEKWLTGSSELVIHTGIIKGLIIFILLIVFNLYPLSILLYTHKKTGQISIPYKRIFEY